jgi:hypothetical protein
MEAGIFGSETKCCNGMYLWKECQMIDNQNIEFTRHPVWRWKRDRFNRKLQDDGGKGLEHME